MPSLLEILDELINGKSRLEYRCKTCNGSIARDTKVCPHCGIFLAYIECQHCGFQGDEEAFRNDICPRCGKLVVRRTGCLGIIQNIFFSAKLQMDRSKQNQELEKFFGKPVTILEDRDKLNNHQNIEDKN